MLNIYLCERDDKQRATLVTYVEAGIKNAGVEAKVVLETGDPEDMLAHIQENHGANLYFLDVGIKLAIDGIELAKKIREHDQRGVIAFITDRIELMGLTFDHYVEAIAYILKMDQKMVKAKIEKCIQVASERLSFDKDMELVFKDGWRGITEKVNAINFFQKDENNVHKVVMYTREKKCAFYGTLNEIEKMDTSFFRCHRKTIVNIRNIKQIQPSGIIEMTNGDTCLCSARKLKELMATRGQN